MKDDETITIKYIVHYGPKKLKDRKKAEFDNESDAADFFKRKSDAGYHVDAFKETVTINTFVEKLS